MKSKDSNGLFASPHQFFEENLIRPVTYNGELYMLAVDVAKALGYKNSQPVIDGCKKHGFKLHKVAASDIKDAATGRTDYKVPVAGNPERVLLNLPAVFTVLTKDKSKKAEPFQNWVCQVLLPKYYRHGYVSREEFEEMQDRALIAEAALLLVEDRDKGNFPWSK